MVSKSSIEEIVELRNNGASIYEIADITGVRQYIVCKVIKIFVNISDEDRERRINNVKKLYDIGKSVSEISAMTSYDYYDINILIDWISDSK